MQHLAECREHFKKLNQHRFSLWPDSPPDLHRYYQVERLVQQAARIRPPASAQAKPTFHPEWQTANRQDVNFTSAQYQASPNPSYCFDSVGPSNPLHDFFDSELSGND